ncbi:hypothetical protein TcWFU_008870 [Taenia crassiceps]|uniref:Uncharacterized protein n=1 Tax=Taenia crassiceps TaxID=6207 RepID=A0ABR4QBT9_9CEST
MANLDADAAGGGVLANGSLQRLVSCAWLVFAAGCRRCHRTGDLQQAVLSTEMARPFVAKHPFLQAAIPEGEWDQVMPMGPCIRVVTLVDKSYEQVERVRARARAAAFDALIGLRSVEVRKRIHPTLFCIEPREQVGPNTFSGSKKTRRILLSTSMRLTQHQLMYPSVGAKPRIGEVSISMNLNRWIVEWMDGWMAIWVNATPTKLHRELDRAPHKPRPSHLKLPQKVNIDRLVIGSVYLGVECKQKLEDIVSSMPDSKLESWEIPDDDSEKKGKEEDHDDYVNDDDEEYQEDEGADEYEEDEYREEHLEKDKSVHGVGGSHPSERHTSPSHDDATESEDSATTAKVTDGPDLSTPSTESTKWKMQFYTYKIY